METFRLPNIFCSTTRVRHVSRQIIIQDQKGCPGFFPQDTEPTDYRPVRVVYGNVVAGRQNGALAAGGSAARVLYHPHDEYHERGKDCVRSKHTDERVDEHVHAPIAETPASSI